MGTVFVAVVTPAGGQARRFRFPDGRDAVRWQATQAALDTLRRALLD